MPLTYPVTRCDPVPLADFSRKEERERLSPSAVRAFLNIMECWKIRDEDARRLLAMSNGPYHAMKKFPERTLDQDRLLRVSYLVGIFKALNILPAARVIGLALVDLGRTPRTVAWKGTPSPTRGGGNSCADLR